MKKTKEEIRAEALDNFFWAYQNAPSREDWRNNCYFKKLQAFDKWHSSTKAILRDYINDLGGSLKVKVSEIQEDVDFMKLLLTLMSLGLTDKSFFDMEDSETIEKLNYIKEKYNWDVKSPATDNVVKYLFT